jgi:hypothetical protein
MVTEVKTSSLMVCVLWAAAHKPACGLAATVTKTMILDIVFLLTEFLAAFPGRVFVLADGRLLDLVQRFIAWGIQGNRKWL